MFLSRFRQLMTRVDKMRSYDRFDRPVFVISAPRCGSTFVYEMLEHFPQTSGHRVENDVIWRGLFPWDRLDEPSDQVDACDARPREARLLRRACYRRGRWGCSSRLHWKQRLGIAPIRYIEKTVANCFHIPLIEQIFPDARYILLLRDPRAGIGSMLSGFRKSPDRCEYPMLAQWNPALRYYAYPLPPGWRKQMTGDLDHACAWAWVEHVQTAMKHLEQVPENRCLTLRYEEVIANPVSAMRAMGTFADLTCDAATQRFACESPLSRTTVSPPRADKWKQEHGQSIERMMPLIEPLMRRLGYGDDVQSGQSLGRVA